MAEIDSLEISIQGKMNSAWQSIDAITKKLGKIPAALNNISKTPVKIDFSSKSIDSTRLKYSFEKAFQNTKIDTSNLANNLSKSFGISAQKASEDIKNQFASLVEKSIDSFDGNSAKASNKAIDSIVDSIIKNGKIARADFSESMQGIRQEYEEFYDYFKQHKIYISDYLKYDIGKTEFNDLLERNLSNITREKGKGIELNANWEELSNKFPDIIPKDTINAAEQVLHVLSEIETVRENIKPIPIENLIGSDYDTVVKSIRQKVEDSFESSLRNVFNNAEKSYQEVGTGMNIPVQINEDVITTQIQSAIRKASKIEYEPLKIDFNIDTKKLKSDLTSKLKGLDLSELSNTLSQLKNISIDTKSIIEMSNAISILGRKSATAGIENIPTLTKAVKDMLSAFSEVPKIDSSIVQMTQSLAELAKNGKALSDIKKEIENASSNLNPDLNSKEADDSVERYSKTLAKFQDRIDKLSNEYGGMMNIPGNTFDALIQNMEESLNDLIESALPNAEKGISAFADKIEELQEISKKLKKEPIKINTDIDEKSNLSKIEELREKYKNSGIDFKFTGNSKQLDNEIEKIYSELKKLEEKEKELIDSGNVHTPSFEKLQEDIAKLKNKFGILEGLKYKTEEFENVLNQLKIPTIRENDLTKLLSDLDKVEAKAEKIKVEMSNKIAKGEMAENVDDSGYRKLSETLFLLGKTADALREKIKYVNQQTEELNEKKLESFINSLENLRFPPIYEANLEKLQRELEKEEQNLKKLWIGFKDDLTMGKITESIDDSAYRDIAEKITKEERQVEALKERIKEVQGVLDIAAQNTSGAISEEQKAVLQTSEAMKILEANKKKASKANKELGDAADSTKDDIKKEEKQVGLLSSALNNFKIAITQIGKKTSNISLSTKKLNTSFSKATSGIKSFAKQLLGLAGVYGTLRGIQDAIKNSIGYIETLNYFDAAFNQVASKADLSSFEKMGYESADSYYKSFSERAEQLTAKMSGFSIGETGLLESTRQTNLGLDPERLMNYQAMFGQMSSSMGVSAETSLKLSQVLTELGADLASVKNIEFEKVWEDMASGLAGMSRTLDKYGVNIRNVNLQQELSKLGIEANINALNQNDKVLLRTIVLLNSTQYAWADLADTINQPANQLRLIQSNFQNLSRTIGNLFLPLLKTVLPYINALVIALQRLFAWIGNLMGIDLSGITNAIGGADISDALDQMDDFSGGISEAKKEADKLNKSIRQFDELKVITTKQDEDDPGSGSGIPGGLLDAAFEDAFSEYQQVWDEAFGNLENKAQELADKIEGIFDPIKYIIETTAEWIKGLDFTNFNQSVEKLKTSLEPLTGNIGEGLRWFYEDVLLKIAGWVIEDAIPAFLNLLAAAIDALNIVIEAFKPYGEWLWNNFLEPLGKWVGDKIIEAIEKITGLLEKFSNWASENKEKIEGIATTIGILATAFIGLKTALGLWNTISSLAAPIISGLQTALEFLLTPVGLLTTGLALLAGGLVYVFATNEDVRNGFMDAVSTIKDNLQPAIEFITDTVLPNLRDGWDRLLEILKPFGDFLETVFTSIWQDMLNPALKYIGEKLIPTVIEVFKNLWNDILVPFAKFLGDVLEPVIKVVSDLLKKLWKKVVVPLAKFIGEVFAAAFEGLATIFNDAIVPKVNFVIDVLTELWKNVLSPIVDFLIDTFEPAFDTVFDGIGKLIGNLKDVFTGLIDFVVGMFTRDWEKAWDGVVSIFKGIFEGITNIVQTVMGTAIDIINGIIKGINKVSSFIGLGEIPEIGKNTESIKKGSTDRWDKKNSGNNYATGSMLGVLQDIGKTNEEQVKKYDEMIKGINKIETPNININIDEKTIFNNKKLNSRKNQAVNYGLASGGFPKPYSIFAAGEGGVPEILGTVGGKTAVAGGAEITGIREAIAIAAHDEVTLLREQNKLLQLLLAKETGITQDDIGRAAQRYAKEHFARTGKEAYAM